MTISPHTALFFAGLLASAPGHVNFDSLRQGVAPQNWTTINPADGSSFLRVRFDASAPSRGNVLEASARGATNPMAVFDPVTCRDGDLSVKFRIDSQASAGTAGVVWRYRDPKNYDVLDFSSSQGVIGMYQVRDGVRQQVRLRGAKSGNAVLKHEVKSGEWHLVRVNFRGNRIKVFLGHRRLFEADDSGFRGAGKAGLVTSGSLTAIFDDFRIEKKS